MSDHADSTNAEPSALVPGDILNAVDAAIAEQGQWSARWHRSLVCGLPLPDDVKAEGSEHLTEFGRWRTRHGDDPLLTQPAFQGLWERYTAMHDAAQRIACSIERPDDRIHPEDYDGFLSASDRFLSAARRIRDAFRKAVSDLDPLTGLSNRATMTAELTIEYERAVRSGTPCCLALADIDFFKKVNDTYGHAAGDEVLAATAGRLTSHLRPYDMIYRYGGEEFLICLPNADTDIARAVLERLRESMAERPIKLEDGRDLPVTASFGLAQITKDADLKTVIDRADAALYQSKEHGRNRVTAHDDSKAGA